MSSAHGSGEEIARMPLARESTLLELVCVVNEFAASEAEVVATVTHLVRSGRVRLRGNFRGSLLEDI
ncbi:MAG TPA: hypothetical protein VKM54_26075 [Myxococcota bacterium]|nr:hypothetical protein [Myxococcota bacterium]